MKLFFLLAILAFISGVALLIVIALWRHKKASMGEIKLIGEIGEVVTILNPEGTVMVQGELWPARSREGETVSPTARVRIVEFQGHLAVVEVLLVNR